MVKKCLDGSKPFGLCLPAGFGYLQYGTAAEITHAEALPSESVMTSIGSLPRYVVECESYFRFKVVKRMRDEDGLDSAIVDRVEDVEPEDDVQEHQSESITPAITETTYSNQFFRYQNNRHHGTLYRLLHKFLVSVRLCVIFSNRFRSMIVDSLKLNTSNHRMTLQTSPFGLQIFFPWTRMFNRKV
jgi:hypothetical protein